MGVVEELGSIPIAPMCRNIMIGSTRPGSFFFFSGMPLRENGAKEPSGLW
jgi:hypothetical protein